MQKQKPDQFAYGKNNVNGYPCPAQAAGRVPGHDETTTPVSDGLVCNSSSYWSDTGVVDEEEAKAAWMAAIEYWEQATEQATGTSNKRRCEKYAAVGRDIAHELGWMGEHCSMARDTALDEVKDELHAEWDEHEEEYRDSVNYEGSEVVYEDDEIAIIGDRGGHVLSNLLRDHETPTRVVRNQMADIAADKTEYDWSDTTAIVFFKNNAN